MGERGKERLKERHRERDRGAEDTMTDMIEGRKNTVSRREPRGTD